MKVVAVSILVLLLATLPANAGAGIELPASIVSWLDAHVASMRTANGQQMPRLELPQFVEGQIGGKPAGLLRYTLEGVRGGTDYLEYVAVFWKVSGNFKFCCTKQVGGKGLNSIEKVSFLGNGLVLTGMQFVPGKDAMCCPSRPFQSTLVVQDGELIEVGPPSNKSLERTRDR